MGYLAATDKVITTLPEALVNTALGMGTVFCVLVLISFIIYLLRFVPDLLNGKSKKEAASVAATSKAPAEAPKAAPKAAPAAEINATEDTQLVAVIAAAIEAAMEQEGTPVPADGLVIRSIKKRY